MRLMVGGRVCTGKANDGRRRGGKCTGKKEIKTQGEMNGAKCAAGCGGKETGSGQAPLVCANLEVPCSRSCWREMIVAPVSLKC
ncbi:hypothetical protein D3C86_1951040 [compost metagenome]